MSFPYFLFISISGPISAAFVPPPPLAPCLFSVVRHRSARQLGILLRRKGWDVADDWESLSSTDDSIDASSIFNSDLASDAARAMEGGVRNDAMVEDEDPVDTFVGVAVDAILNPPPDPSDPPLYDTVTSFERYAKSVSFEDNVGREIGLLVRCNQRPEELLVSEGRALPILEDSERYDPIQLVRQTSEGNDEPTEFFRDAVGTMFRAHSILNKDGQPALDRSSVAKWMSQSLDESVGPHDKDVSKLISKYGTYGTGVLTEPEFMSLYLDTVVTALEGAKVFRGKELSEAVISGVWNDLINHDIPSPAEAQRSLLEEKMREKYGDGVVPQTSSISNLMDECEIIEMSEMDHTNSGYGSEDDYKSETKSSYEKVELALDGTTPKRIRDGDFGEF